MRVLEFHLFKVPGPKAASLLSVLSPEDLQGRPLPPFAVVGEVLGDTSRLTRENFTPNATFMAFLQWVISRHGVESPILELEAKRLGNGTLHLVDRRTSATGDEVPRHDLLGSFEVVDGQMRRYLPCTGHLLLSDDGLLELESFLATRLHEEMVRALQEG